MAITANRAGQEHRWVTTAETADTVAAEIHTLASFTTRRDVTISWADGSRPGTEFVFVYQGDSMLVDMTPLWAAVNRLRDAGIWLEVFSHQVEPLRNVPR